VGSKTRNLYPPEEEGIIFVTFEERAENVESKDVADDFGKCFCPSSEMLGSESDGDAIPHPALPERRNTL